MAKRTKTQEVKGVKTSGKSAPKKKPPLITSPQSEPLFELNAKQSYFIHYYIRNKGNALQAYMKAYECDYDSAKANASRLIANDNIQAIIKQRQQEMAAALNYDRDTWLRTLVAMATYDPIMEKRLKKDHDYEIIHPGEEVYGYGCRPADRKAAMDELRDVLGFRNQSDSGIKDSTVRDVLADFRGRKK